MAQLHREFREVANVHRRKTERGAVLITMALWLTAFMAFAAVAIDIGRVSFTANEVQAIADVAATAGATALFRGGRDAQAEGATVANLNRVDGKQASVSPSDLELGK